MMDLEKTVLGIELGSTRIKAVLIDGKHIPIAQGDFEWENQLVSGRFRVGKPAGERRLDILHGRCPFRAADLLCQFES